MGNSVHCLILRTTMNNIDMRRIGRYVELPLVLHCHVLLLTVYLTTYTSLSPIWRGFVPGCVNCKKGAVDSQRK